MIPRASQPDRSATWMFILSFTLHLLIIIACNNTDLFRSPIKESTPYYVDIVSLPALDPAPPGGESASAAAAPPLPAPATQAAPAQKPAMAVPVKQPPSAGATPPVSPDQSQKDQEAREFSERMSRLERSSEARHQSDALAALQKKTAEKKGSDKKRGGSADSGIDKGSDYGAYIQSRLKDALGSTIVFRSQNPEVAVHLYIDKTGKLLRYVMIRPSPDKLFNNSVIRTIEKAKADFPPVPSGRDFDKLYVFSPQEVKK